MAKRTTLRKITGSKYVKVGGITKMHKKPAFLGYPVGPYKRGKKR